jgi:hypothetical protein
MNGLSKVLVCLTLFVAACGGDSTAPGTTTIAGSYALQTINGSPLPYAVVQVGADKVEVLNETVTLSEGGTFTQQGSVRLTENGVVSTQSYSDAGTYTRNGTAISFFFNSDGSSGTGTVSGNTITVAFSGFSLVYRK